MIAAGGREGEIYAGLKTLRDHYADARPRKVSRHPAARLRLQPRRAAARKRVQRRPRPGRQRRHLARHSRCHAQPRHSLRSSAPWSVSALKTSSSPPIMSRIVLTHKPIGLEGLDGCCSTRCAQAARLLDDIPLLPEGRGFLLVEFGGNTQAEADGQAQALVAALKGARRARRLSRIYNSAEATASGTSANPALELLPSFPASAWAGRDGKTPPSAPSSLAPICAPSTPS